MEGDEAFETAGNLMTAAVIPIALSCAFAIIWLAMPVHASQDFLIASGNIGVDASPSLLSFIVLPTMIGLAILLWLRRHRIDLETARESGLGVEGLEPRPSTA